jgi:hypothetical protein
MLRQALGTHRFRRLAPYVYPERAAYRAVNLPPSTTFVAGQILGTYGSSANAVHTITDTPTITDGTFTLTYVHPLTFETVETEAIAYNANNATLQAAIEAVLGTGTVAVTGSGLPGNDTTLTYQGNLAGRPIPLPTVDNDNLTGGTLAVASTTVGRTAGQVGVLSLTAVTAPTTAPSVSGTGSGGGWAAADYGVSYTYVTAYGESTPSPAAHVTVTADQLIRVAQITSIPTGVTHVRYYIDGELHATTAVSSGTAAQTDIDDTPTGGGRAPSTNMAYAVGASGITNAIGIMQYDCETDEYGQIYLGEHAVGQLQKYEAPNACVDIYTAGYFKTSELTGLNAEVLRLLGGRLWKGTIADGVIVIPG